MRPTGVGIVDHVLGGFPPGLPLVLAGESGSGRTVLSLQLAQAALERGEIVELVSSEPAPSLLHQARALGFPFEQAVADGRLALLELDASAASLVRAQGVAPLVAALQAEAPDAGLVLVDPFTALTAEIVDEPKLREVGRALVRSIAARHLVLTVESERLAQQRGLERVLSELCGAYLLLEREASGARWLVVEKSRSGQLSSERVEFAIGAGGMHLVGAAEPKFVLRAEVAVPAAPVARQRRGARVQAPPAETVAPPPPPASAETAPPRDAAASTAPPPRATTRAAPLARAPAAPPSSLATAPTASPAPGIDGAPRPTILVVEDTRLQRELLSEWLGDRYHVLTASDGFEALAVFLTHRPDLVLLDLVMPRVTGYELLAAVRRASLDVPVLVTSSRVQSAAERLGPMVLGATDFLPKPLNRLELEHKVELLLQLRRGADRRFDPAEAEALFGRGSLTRQLEDGDFRDRLARAVRFGDRYGMPSSLLRVSAPDGRSLDRWIDVAGQELRFEDAILRPSKRRAWVLLVATRPVEAPLVVERLQRASEEAHGRPLKLHVEVGPATAELADDELAEADA